jgi:hypothetical protein
MKFSTALIVLAKQAFDDAFAELDTLSEELQGFDFDHPTSW